MSSAPASSLSPGARCPSPVPGGPLGSCPRAESVLHVNRPWLMCLLLSTGIWGRFQLVAAQGRAVTTFVL